jgi:hypothetical protein
MSDRRESKNREERFDMHDRAERKRYGIEKDREQEG